ncbi:SH3 domain-binding protein 5 [Dictyocaulus viviparus]|uniref:SH3 domain-binding protein 5 n=1 Tax=Dictyocaulus viviparus TaxID=29172 RepID=A0A0D8XH45_DICVI|nr:SH3 domain-binding protein 5 [Dictyocaulus viviparus]
MPIRKNHYFSMPELEARNDVRIPNIGSSAKALSSRSDSCADSVLNYSELEYDDSPLDQKHLNLVHEELEKLNIATDVINKLEVQLDAARVSFREIQACWSEKLKELSKKYSSAIAKARPYYEAKIQERKLRDESLRAAIRFERATSLLAVAKQQVALTQDSLNRQTMVHPECLEVYKCIDFFIRETCSRFY